MVGGWRSKSLRGNDELQQEFQQPVDEWESNPGYFIKTKKR